MNKLINQMFDDLFPMPSFEATKKVFNRFRIPVNILESDKSYQLQLVIPGIDKKDIKIEVDNLTLTVSYEMKEVDANMESKTVYLRQDFQVPSFKKSFNLGESIDTDALKAQFENGILNIHLPKKSVVVPEKKQLVVE